MICRLTKHLYQHLSQAAAVAHLVEEEAVVVLPYPGAAEGEEVEEAFRRIGPGLLSVSICPVS